MVGDNDAYGAIAYEVDVHRNIVKGFINIALNTTSFESAKRAESSHQSITQKDSQAVSKDFDKIYKVWICIVNLEGLVMRKVMMQGIQKNIIALPIHDAVIVEFDNQWWA